jgi:hypothetical protein
MRKILKKCMACIVASVLLLFSFSGCADRADSFTIEEHIQRIGERMRARDLTKKSPYGFTYDNFEVYPLYNENDEVKYFLIEFEPCGFILIYLREQASIINSRTLYTMFGFHGNENPWSPYVVEKGEDVHNYENRKWLLDENGERIYYSKSPYYVANCINEKKYLFKIKGGFIPAIKRDDNFINLISGEIINSITDNVYHGEAVLDATIIPKRQFDL